MKLVLASGSPRRRELLEEAGFSFEVVVSPAEEEHDATVPLAELCERNAAAKALAVAVERPEAVVLGADTLVWIDGEPLGKPRDLAEAREMLGKLSGHAHTVCTGVCVAGGGRVECFHELTEVVFRDLDAAAIARYFERVNPLDKAGAYAVQEHGEMVVAEVRGDFSNVVGLPLGRVTEVLRGFGVETTMNDPEKIEDPFREARERGGVLRCPFRGEEIAMILRHAEVREAARDWQTFSSDAPFRVPIPSEEEVRTVRQLPIETDPPEHGAYRALVEPFFQRAKRPEVVARVEALVDGLLAEALGRGELEVVHEFALPLQSRALTHLLNVPESEAEVWIGWGIHVFKATSGGFKRGNVLEDYLQARFDRAEAEGGDDFFSALARAEIGGRRLTREEMMGFGNLTFAGGRDTIIHSISSVIAYFGTNPQALAWLREDPRRSVHAAEEFFRVFMPLTHIGRVCPRDTEVGGVMVEADRRISLCWAAVNLDPEVFPAADEIRLDRKPNPHVAFGFGEHLCLGAPHARLVVRALLQALVRQVARVEVVEAVEQVEREAAYQRRVGYERLVVRIVPLAGGEG